MKPRKFRAGDLVAAFLRDRLIKEWILSAPDADDLNDGENPLHPWKANRFQLVEPMAGLEKQ